MTSAVPVIHVSPRDLQLLPLLDALSAELAEGGYTAEQTFGYSVEQLEQSGVHSVAAVVDGRYAGIGGLELQGAGIGVPRFAPYTDSVTSICMQRLV